MIFLADFQPLSVANTNIFHQQHNQGFTEKFFSDTLHAILIEEVLVKLMLHDGASFRSCRLTSLLSLRTYFRLSLVLRDKRQPKIHLHSQA